MPLDIDDRICTSMDSAHNQHMPHLQKLILSDVKMVTRSHVTSCLQHTQPKMLCGMHGHTYHHCGALLVWWLADSWPGSPDASVG
jgi:hypothetical protein